MQLRHKFLIGLSISLLGLSLFGIGLFGSMYVVVGKSGPIKSALRDSGIYQTGIGDALDESQKNKSAQDNGKEDIPTDKPEVRSVIAKSFPPEYVQTQAERALDALYAWLQGKTPALTFSIDVTDAKTRLADGMAGYIQSRVDTLPACTAANIPSGGEVDAFNAACLPPGFNKAEAVSKARDDILNGDFLKEAKFDIGSAKNDSGKTLGQQLQAVPNIYQYFLITIFMLGGSALVLSAAIVWLGGSWRAGLRRLGIVLAVVGAFCAGLGWASSFAVHRATIEFTKTEAGNQPLQQKVIRIIELLVNDFRSFLMDYGIALIVLGAAAIAVWYFTRHSGSVAEAKALAGAGKDRELVAITDTKKLPAPKAGRAGAKPKLPEIKE